uniref:Putative secreted protein n=1 Tax=Anopheles marajoara TaxID=58244 RepID=A0A2M4CCF5_9DIPT
MLALVVVIVAATVEPPEWSEGVLQNKRQKAKQTNRNRAKPFVVTQHHETTEAFALWVSVFQENFCSKIPNNGHIVL